MKAGRKRFVAVGNKWVEVSPDYEQPAPNRDSLLWNDRLYQDDGDPRYNSRAEHREYARRNNLSLASDYTETWAKAAKERAAWYQEGKDSTRREDVARALATHRSK